MSADFGLLVDFLRGELDEPAMAEVRTRLEHDDALFRQFERLRRTYAVLRSMPNLKPQQGTPNAKDTPAADIPLTEPREEFIRDVRHEFQARGWAGLIPRIAATPEYLSALRVEFAVRAIAASLPMLAVADSFLEALHAEFGARARVDSLPFIKARPGWIRELREEFAVRALVGSLPMLDVRPEFAAALREEFSQRALVGSLPQLDVRAGFERRLKVALVEAQAEQPAAETATPVLPSAGLPKVDASDSFRRRLFKKILVNSRRAPRETPKRVDVNEYQFGREISRGWKGGRRSVAVTMTLHAVAIVIMLFIFVNPQGIVAKPYVAKGEATNFVPPALPDRDLPEAEMRTPSGRENSLPFPNEGDWSSADAQPPLGLDGNRQPDRDISNRTDVEPPPPERDNSFNEQVLAEQMRDNASSYFRLRGLPREQKVDYLGSNELYESLGETLAWLQRHQLQDGSWGYVEAGVKPTDPELQTVQKLEMTSAAVLAFLGDGHSSEKSPLGYDFTVRRAVSWILSKQAATGQIGPAEKGNVMIHAMATLALAEDFGLTRAQRLREPLRQACRWLCNVKAKGTDGFPMLIGRDASLISSVWAYMALATARNVQVPPIDLPQERISAFLSWFQEATNSPTKALHDDAQVLAQTELLPTAAASALSLFAVEAGYQERCKALVAKVNREMPSFAPMGDDIPKTDNADPRFLFFGSMTQALNLQRNGRRSNEWYDAFKKALLTNQLDDGSYAPTSLYDKLYGKVYDAAFAALSIENAYRVSILNK
ncbi:MAG: terpene cyclase/mutase family protein [Planctomycetes bacterium]|nr:terpene cyclase/mutase family protein [Planctomycetota bacterium]